MRFAERATDADYPLGLLKDELDPRLVAIGSTMRFRTHVGECADEGCSRVATVIKSAEYNKNRDSVYITVVFPLEKFPLEEKRLLVATRSTWGNWQLALRSTVAVVIPRRDEVPELADDVISEAS